MIVDKDKYINEVMTRIQPTVHLKDANDCDLIVEAIPEHIGLKLKLYKELGMLCCFIFNFIFNIPSICLIVYHIFEYECT